jgi:dTDP-4-dehydrorhamnose 3,5-epimerase-like enzyme
MKLEDQYKVIEFADFGDERGNLVVIEGNGRDIPFDMKRVFYIYGSDAEVVRGQHANRRTEFIMVNVCGTSKVRIDNGKESTIIELNKPRMGLYISSMVWKDMYSFSSDSILLVIASEHYDSAEYIRNYDDFKKEIAIGNEVLS